MSVGCYRDKWQIEDQDPEPWDSSQKSARFTWPRKTKNGTRRSKCLGKTLVTKCSKDQKITVSETFGILKQSFVATKSEQPKTWMNKVLQISVKYLWFMIYVPFPSFSSFEPFNVATWWGSNIGRYWVRPKVNAWPSFRHVKFQVGNLSTLIISYIESCQFQFTAKQQKHLYIYIYI